MHRFYEICVSGRSRFWVFGKILIFGVFNDLRSQIFFVIRVEGHNGRLHAKFEPFISIFRTKCSLYKFWCCKGLKYPPLSLKKSRFFPGTTFPPKFIKSEQKMFLYFNIKIWQHLENLCTFWFYYFTSSSVLLLNTVYCTL